MYIKYFGVKKLPEKIYLLNLYKRKAKIKFIAPTININNGVANFRMFCLIPG